MIALQSGNFYWNVHNDFLEQLIIFYFKSMFSKFATLIEYGSK